MKTSVLLSIAILLNTTLLMAEPLVAFVRGVNPWILIFSESMLVIGYLVNGFLKNFSRAVEIDFGHLNVFVFKKEK